MVREDLTETEQKVIKVLEDRWEKGRESYNKGIDAGDYDSHHWVSEAIEEAADLLQYLVAMKLRMEDQYRKERACNVCGIHGSPIENTPDHIGFFCSLEHYNQWATEQNKKGIVWRSMGLKHREGEK